jgi:hypothetical protein
MLSTDHGISHSKWILTNLHICHMFMINKDNASLTRGIIKGVNKYIL